MIYNIDCRIRLFHVHVWIDFVLCHLRMYYVNFMHELLCNVSCVCYYTTAW